jgi:mannose-1-phosphate guanylyltransferase
MPTHHDIWALLLAAGDGTRLRSLTTTACGAPVPKQFCSLYEGPSLLQEALDRAQAVSSEDRTCVVVAAQHRRWWEQALRGLPPDNVIVQPQNRGTGLGILLPLLHILSRNPSAQLVLLPSDHHVRDEVILSGAIRRAVDRLESWHDEVVLLGVEPEELDPELGYVVPGPSDGAGMFKVERFVEKPSLVGVNELIRAGGFWNTFIMVSSGRALLDLFRRRYPEIVDVMSSALQSDWRAGSQGSSMAALYQQLPSIDFSRDILPAELSHLRVARVLRCGWSDLGTPRRVFEVLRRTAPARPGARSGPGYLSLATQHEWLLHAEQRSGTGGG